MLTVRLFCDTGTAEDRRVPGSGHDNLVHSFIRTTIRLACDTMAALSLVYKLACLC